MFLDDEGLHNLMGLDEAMEKFMHRFVNSFIKWELVNYFHDHPHTPCKTADLAKTLNRPLDPVKRELKDLQAEGLIRELKTGKKIEYTYDLAADNPQHRQLSDLLNQFIHLCRTREGRLRVIYKILKNGKPITA